MADAFDNLLVSCPNGGGLFLFSDGTIHKLDGFDTTGLAASGMRVVRAIQPDDLAMLGHFPQTLAGTERRFDDLHDVLLDGRDCYVVNTRDNAIVKLDAVGTEIRRWTFPGESDSWHVNCLAQWNGRIVFSAFSDRPGHKAYKEPPLDGGFVQDLETGDRLLTNLFQPHSLVASGKRLLLANSGAFELHEYDSKGKLIRKLLLDGYTRGIATHGKRVYVGLSKTRNVEVSGLAGATLVALDATTWQEVARVTLPADEIYSVLPLQDATAMGIVAGLASHASARSAALLKAQETELQETRGRLSVAVERSNALDGQVRETERQVFGLLETVQGKDVQIQNRDEIIRGKDAEVQRRDDLVRARDEALRDRDAVLKDSERRIHGLLETVQGKDVQIQNRDEIIQARDDRVADLAQALRDNSNVLAGLGRQIAEVHARLEARTAEVTAREQVIAAMQATLSWRLTGPFRKIQQACTTLARSRPIAAAVRPVNKARHVAGTLRSTLRNPELRAKYWTLARLLGPRAAAHHTLGYLRRGGPRLRPALPPPEFDLQRHRAVVILTTGHCLFVATSIARALERIGVQSKIITERPANGYE
ncbi:MAG: DUF4915 domain-containing protein, partial [Gammaproteobacteria bacterium]